MGSITLSVCIATFNRAALIGETLESIISQGTDEVEIVVVDGASPDETEQVVRQYQLGFHRLRYFKQATNMGVDRGFSRAVELARGQYCWLFSDDDLLKPGAIQGILREIRLGYALVVVNAEVRTTDLRNIVDRKRLRIESNRIYDTPKESQRLFTDTAFYLSFIGCVVIKRDLWIQREKIRYFDSAFVHVGVIFQCPLPQNTLVIADPWITIRYGSAQWTSRAFEIWMFNWPNLVWSFAEFSEKSKRQICPRQPWKRIRILLAYRAKGAFSKKEYRDWIEPIIGSGWRRIAARLVVEIPGWALNILAISYYYVISRQSRLSLVDLQNSQFHYSRYLHPYLIRMCKMLAGNE